MAKKIIKKILFTFLFISITFLTLFITLSLYFRVDSIFVASVAILLFLLSYVAVVFHLKRLSSWSIYAVFVAIWFYWYATVHPSNERIWQKDVAVLSYATINDTLITVHNIRNFSYTSEDNYEAHYYDETYDINTLQGIDFIATYWMGSAIAHTFLSFSFADGKHLAISIEVRKKQGESYSMIRGFFRENELYYVVADERDLIGLRTNIRENPPEQVYMYQINAKTEDMKKVFLNYMQKINDLKNTPEFYNTLTTNCTTTIWNNSLVNYSDMRFSWEILLSGYSARYLYKNGLLKTYGLNFEELQKRAYINPLVDSQAIDANFSSKIRANERQMLKNPLY